MRGLNTLYYPQCVTLPRFELKIMPKKSDLSILYFVLSYFPFESPSVNENKSMKVLNIQIFKEKTTSIKLSVSPLPLSKNKN